MGRPEEGSVLPGRPSSATLEQLAALVAMDTTSRNSNLELIGFVEELLDAHGISHARVLNADGTKANLVAHIGPDSPGGVVLSGHTDCVPVDGQPWSTDPFSLTEANGRLYGRGVTDMKGFLAAVLAKVPKMEAAPLTRPIQFAFTFDEELGTLGGPSAVQGLLSHYPRPEIAIIGEPTSMQVATAHKGLRCYRISVTGRDAHSSQPHRAANAIAALARVATYIDDLARQHRDAAAGPSFDPPYTTFNLGTISGGQAMNIVARHAELTFEYRPVPADDDSRIAEDIERFAQDEVLPELRRSTGVGTIDVELLAVARSLRAEADGPAEQLARALSGHHGPAQTVSYGTDAGHFQAADLSTVVIGPGDISQAHQPDEWIEATQLAACEDFLDGLIEHLSA